MWNIYVDGESHFVRSQAQWRKLHGKMQTWHRFGTAHSRRADLTDRGTLAGGEGQTELTKDITSCRRRWRLPRGRLDDERATGKLP